MSLAMLVLTLVVPAEYTTQVLLALLFWAGNVLVIGGTLQLIGGQNRYRVGGIPYTAQGAQISLPSLIFSFLFFLVFMLVLG